MLSFLRSGRSITVRSAHPASADTMSSPASTAPTANLVYSADGVTWTTSPTLTTNQSLLVLDFDYSDRPGSIDVTSILGRVLELRTGTHSPIGGLDAT
jgi:hypothetical protein